MRGKSYFAAANTGAGFYNCFDQINDSQKDGFLYILKGGSGTGKSTLMKKIGTHFENSGEEVEYFFCSSDEESLDGVRLVRANAAIVDGTAPHVVETAMAGVTDAIINLGKYIGAGVKAQKNKIGALIQKKKACFDTAYAYIKAAAALDYATMKVYANVTDMNAVKEIADRLWQDIKIKGGGMRNRKLFLSAVAKDGKTSFLAQNKYTGATCLDGNPFAARLILDDIAARLDSENCGYISFCEVLCPDRREALQIGKDYILTAGSFETGAKLSLENTLIKNLYSAKQDGILYGLDAVNQLLGLAAKALTQAKSYHMQIEACYIPAMDFKGLDYETENLICNLSEYLSSIK